MIDNDEDRCIRCAILEERANDYRFDRDVFSEEKKRTQEAARVQLAQLRHLYAQMVVGQVTDPRTAAEGLLAPAIRFLEGVCR